VPAPETARATLVACVAGVTRGCTAFIVNDESPFTVTLPLILPTAFGENVTLNDALCPAAKVVGNMSPLTMKAPLLAESCETVTSVPPVFVKVAACI